MTGAAVIVVVAKIWLWIGAAVAVAFLTVGIDRVEENARGAYVVRPLLVPGILMIWPLVLWRWWILETGRDDWAARHDPPRDGHRVAALAMAAAIVLAIASGLLARQVWPDGVAPVRVAAPAEGTGG